MSKENPQCNIVKDLLPLYLEELCSQDSRNYVEAHLSQCEACRSTCALLSQKLPDAESVPDQEPDQELNALKKLKSYLTVQLLTGYLLFLAVLSIGVFILLLTVSTNKYYFECHALLMPLTLLATDFAFHGKTQTPCAKSGRALLIPQLLLLLFGTGMMFYVFLILYFNPEATPLGVPLNQTGPILAAVFWTLTLLSLSLLALHLYQTFRGKLHYGIMPAVSILCIFLNVTYLSMLYRMSSFQALMAELLHNTLILCVTALLLTLVLTLIRKTPDGKPLAK